MDTLTSELRRIVREAVEREVNLIARELALDAVVRARDVLQPNGRVLGHLTTAEAAQEVGRHPGTILKLVQLGEIHGTQRVKGGKWLVRTDCLRAWVEKTPCPHQNVTPLRHH